MKDSELDEVDQNQAAQAQGWVTLSALHTLLENDLERALVAGAGLSVVEFTVLDAIARQDGFHLRMLQVSRAAALSASATTRLVNRLEGRGLLRRYLCAEDRRGVYSELTESGQNVLSVARPIHDEVLSAALRRATQVPELRDLAAFISAG